MSNQKPDLQNCNEQHHSLMLNAYANALDLKTLFLISVSYSPAEYAIKHQKFNIHSK